MKKTIALFLCLFATPLLSQNIPRWNMLTTVDGLSQGMIFDIIQSKDGFIWIATKDGLNRYDGARFKVFSPDPFDPFAIGDSEVHKLFEDSRGWIWVLLRERLDVLDPVSGLFFHVMREGKPLLFKQANDLAKTPDGAVWVSDDDRVWEIKPSNDLLTKAIKQRNAYIEPASKFVRFQNAGEWPGEPLKAKKLFFSKENKQLVGTTNGLFRVDAVTVQIVPELPIPGYYIETMAESDSGDMLIRARQANRSLFMLLSKGKILYKKECLPDRSPSLFSFDNTGHFWGYTLTHNVIQKWQTARFFSNGVPELEIPASALHLENNNGYGCTVFTVDKSGNVWVGTSGYGIIKINGTGQIFKTALQRTAHNLMYEGPDGALFTGAIPGKKFLSKSFDHSVPDSDLPMLKEEAYRYLPFDPGGNIWWLHQNQIFRRDAVSKATMAWPFEGIGLICDRNGKLVSVNEKGLHRFDPSIQTSQDFPFEKPQNLAPYFSHYLYEDSEGVIWVFGFDGLIKAAPNQTGYTYVHYRNDPTDRNSLCINTVLSVCDDPLEPRRYLWVGTKAGGLNRLDKQSGKFKQYKTEQGLPDNVVYGILAENKAPFIWMSTNKGLCRFDVRAETTKNFTATDGLQDNEFNSAGYLKTKDGHLIFAGINGINVFHPDSLVSNKNLPQVHIVGLSVNNRKFDIQQFAYPVMGTQSDNIRNVLYQNITFSHDQNLLTFDFAALEFTNPLQNQYRYQLVGVDRDWVALGNKNSIQFANLAPGDYTFKVDGSNNDGVWSEQPAELKFTILPPWWASWWAYLLYFALTVTGAWLYYRYQLRQRLEHQETLRLRELDDFKSRFFTNITHEFRTPLTVMLGMSEQLTKEEKDEPKRNKLGLIKRSGENLLRLVNQILDLAKLESNALKMNYTQGDILAIIRYIAESLHSLANAQNLMLRVESDQTKIVMDYDPERFLQIIHNLLSNAIKFTPSGGKVTLRANMENQWLHISVSDTGVGIPPDELPHLFERFFQAQNQQHAKAGGTGIGLSLTRELVKAMGGEISVESTLEEGSTFLVKLPVTNNSLFEEKGAEIGKVPRSSRPPALTPTSNDLEGLRILLIEDNPDVVEYLNACLQAAVDREGRPYQLDFAYNGQAGIEKSLEIVPDLIVSDVMMPFKDGFEVLDALKNDERTSHIPIILLTAKADVQSRLAGLRRGADAYLSKPFHQEELLVTVENLLELRRKLQLKYQQNALAPATPVQPETADIEDSFLQKVRGVIETHYQEEDFGLPQLCQKIGMSRSQLFRKMKALTDIAPSDLIRTHRLRKAKSLLESGAANVAEAAWEVGFKDPSYFSKLYQEEFGAPPSATRK